MKPRSSTSLPRAARFGPLIKTAARNALIGYPRLHRACSASYIFVRFLPMFVKQAVRRRSSGEGAQGTFGDGQAVLNWSVNLPKLDSANHLLEWLDLNGVQFQAGGHTIYVPPQEKLAQCFGDVVRFYPEASGFKILKNFGSATDVDYIHGHRGVSVRRKLVGDLSQRLLAANYLLMHNIGPRVWDLSNWHGSGNVLSVFVVEHVDGPEAESDDSAAFVEVLTEMVEKRVIKVLQPNWQESPDFSLPSCNHNLLYSRPRERFVYVDFQDFGIPNWKAVIEALYDERKEAFHFGQGPFLRNQRYFHQSVPAAAEGKRDTERRWRFLKSQLENHGISVRSRMVLDVGCNAGLILHAALREGALWGFGWDLPLAASNAKDLLLMLGTTRFTLTGAQLTEAYPLEEDIPHRFAAYLDEAAVFYLSVSDQLGYLQSLYRMPWRVLVYEGHENQSVSDIANAEWANFGPDVKLVSVARHADGDSPRPFALFLRKSPTPGNVRKKPGAVLPMCPSQES